MSGTTATEGYPFPLPADFADVQDAFRLATSIDANLRAGQAPFRAFESRLSFITTQNANGSGFLTGTQSYVPGTTQWDNTGGVTLGAPLWQQPTIQQPSWWMFGATLLTAIISGTPVVGDMNMARLRITTTDQVSGVATAINAYQRNDETNTNGEWLNVFTMVPIYRATAGLALILNGTTSKAVAAGSTFWGMHLGPVI